MYYVGSADTFNNFYLLLLVALSSLFLLGFIRYVLSLPYRDTPYTHSQKLAKNYDDVHKMTNQRIGWMNEAMKQASFHQMECSDE